MSEESREIPLWEEVTLPGYAEALLVVPTPLGGLTILTTEAQLRTKGEELKTSFGVIAGNSIFRDKARIAGTEQLKPTGRVVAVPFYWDRA